MGAENPEHYKNHPSGIECIQVIYPLFYGAGNAIKYLWRLGMKDSDLQELAKAMWYTKHSMEAQLQYNWEANPFASKVAYAMWDAEEPEGYRKWAIEFIYEGYYDKAMLVIKDWYADIMGIDSVDVLEPAVPAVSMNPYAVEPHPVLPGVVG
jgi:hypothetical protein